MQLTAAETKDIEFVCQIDQTVLGNGSRRKYLTEMIVLGKCLIAKNNEIIVGFIVFDTTFFDNAFICLVIVSPDYRRQGVATALIRHVEINCSMEKLFTSTNESNVQMQRLCQALGFVKSGWIENLDEGDPEIIYFKRLR